MPASTHAIETTAERFEADVIEQSRRLPVVLDYWAAWCQPCRRLAPLLEKMAAEMQGQFALVKADVDQLPQQATAFRVEGIPAVFALRDGSVVDSFTGLLTESQLRQWIRRIVPSEAEVLAREAQSLEKDNLAAAEEKYRLAMELDSRLPDALIGLARVHLARDNDQAASELLSQLEERGFLEPAAQQLKAQLDLRARQLSGEQLAALHKRAAEGDTAARLVLAEGLLAAGQYAEGLPLCLEIVANERGERREVARQAMLSAFRVLGDEAELTREFRRKLAMALY